MNGPFWCVYYPDGTPMLESLGYLRSESLFKASNRFLYYEGTWAKMYRRGYRCRKVNIVPERHDVVVLHDAGDWLIKVTDKSSPMVIINETTGRKRRRK